MLHTAISSLEARWNKARRGEVFTMVPAGYDAGVVPEAFKPTPSSPAGHLRACGQLNVRWRKRGNITPRGSCRREEAVSDIICNLHDTECCTSASCGCRNPCACGMCESHAALGQAQGCRGGQCPQLCRRGSWRQRWIDLGWLDCSEQWFRWQGSRRRHRDGCCFPGRNHGGGGRWQRRRGGHG